MTNLYRHFIAMITEMITGIDRDCVRLWELNDWFITYHQVEHVVNYVIACVIVLTVIWAVFSFCKVIVTRMDKEIEA